MEKKNNKDVAYIIGRVFGCVIAGCSMAIIIAATIRLIMWIL